MGRSVTYAALEVLMEDGWLIMTLPELVKFLDLLEEERLISLEELQALLDLFANKLKLHTSRVN